MKRRDFIKKSAQTGLALSILGVAACKSDKKNVKQMNTEKISSKHVPLFFKISLAEWSLNRSIKSGVMNHLDFAAKAGIMGFDGIEYVNQFFPDKAKDMTYLAEMNHRANSHGLENVLIMIDNEGDLSSPIKKVRLKAIENHYKWVEAAHYLECQSIRVNLFGGIVREEATKASVESLTQLSNFAKGSGLNVIVENHGGFSSDAAWLADVMKKVSLSNCGTLPDFGNFCIEQDEKGNCINEYDRYLGIEEMLPFAKGISAKSFNFDSNGEVIETDFRRVLKMIKESGYNGYIGIEYEGDDLSEDKGIALTKELLRKIGKELNGINSKL